VQLATKSSDCAAYESESVDLSDMMVHAIIFARRLATSHIP